MRGTPWLAKTRIGAETGGPERVRFEWRENGGPAVAHGKGEYVRGDASTNEVESYFALLKRGITGSFHHVSRQHLNLHCDEFSFRWSHRKASDAARTVAAIQSAAKRRLTYKVPIRNEAPF